ncbi:MAG: hypothetical protein ABR549_11535 [Mycobacteriales bacterium]
MPTTAHRYGDFEHQTVTGAFVHDLTTIGQNDAHFGLVQQIDYVYGFLSLDGGGTVCLENKLVHSLSSGTFVMVREGDGGLDVHPMTTRSYRGELRRTATEKGRRWSDPVMFRLPEAIRRSDDLPYLLELDGDRLLWDQGDLCHLEGEIRSLGVQFYSASAREPLYFTSIPYWVSGTVVGRPASGLLFFDRVYMIPNREWKETAMFGDVQISWNLFGNELEDGSIEWGKVVVGNDGFNAGMVVEGLDLVACSNEVGVNYVLNEDGFVDAARYQIGDRSWVFQGERADNMKAFSASRWNGYHSQFGTTRRVGDTRRRLSGFTWLEGFDERMRAAGFVVDSL